MLGEDGSPIAELDRPLTRVMSRGVGEEGTIVGMRRRRDGGVRWLSVSTIPILEARGEITGYCLLRP